MQRMELDPEAPLGPLPPLLLLMLLLSHDRTILRIRVRNGGCISQLSR